MSYPFTQMSFKSFGSCSKIEIVETEKESSISSLKSQASSKWEKIDASFAFRTIVSFSLISSS